MLTSLVGDIRTRSFVARPETVEQCRETLAWCRRNRLTLCARGAGRSYGDLALNDGEVVLDVSRLNRILDIDEEGARVTVEPGTRIIDIYRAVHHRLLTLPASPTESHSSVAGAIAANVNGKDAWRCGSFADQVVRMTLLLADGELREIERSDDLFPAVAGGIGLLGIVVAATLQLRRIPSPYVRVERITAPDTDSLLESMSRVEETHDAAVVWVDVYARGRNSGRSVVHAARWVGPEAVEPGSRRREILEAEYQRLERHRRFGHALHRRLSPLLSLLLEGQRPLVSAFNRLYYARSLWMARAGRASNTELFLRYNFAASFTVPPAHLVCGPRGYTVQLTFPRAAAHEAMEDLLGTCRSSPCPPVTTILRAHRRDECLISFSEDGYSLNFEFHPKRRHEAACRRVVDRLIEQTAARGGKVHLAKDQVLTREQFSRVYPGIRDLLAVKRRLDPEGLFSSDLARRVGIATGEAR